MVYKLFYTDEYGQIVLPNGELDLKSSSKDAYFENYETLDKAKLVAEEFVKRYPLNACMISPGINGDEELIISADDLSRAKAIEIRDIEIQKKLKSIKGKNRTIYLIAFIFAILAVAFWVVLKADLFN